MHDVFPEHDTEVVAIPYTPAPPFETRRLLEDGWDVVERPVQLMVELEPPISAPRMEYPVKGPEKPMVVVATFPSVAGVPFVEVQYARFPAVSEVDVARYEASESVPVVVIVPPLSPVPAVMEVTPLLMEEVATHCGTPLFQARTWPPMPEP